MQFLLHLPCWLGVCELAGETNEWQCPLRGAQRRILIKCCLLPSLTNTASLQWHGEAFGSKALGFRHQTRGKGWGQVSLAEMGPLFFLYDRRSPEILGKCIGALIMLVRLCCKVCFSLFSIWVSYCESARCLERMCKEPQQERAAAGVH